MVNVAQHSGPSLTVQGSDEASGIGGSVTIDGKGNTTVAATYRNATVVSATGNVHDPSSFGNLKGNENFNSDLNQNLAMGKADENLKAGTAELAAGRNKIAETGNEAQREILNNENASAQDQHGVLATLASAGEFLTDPSSASTWLGRTAQDVVGSFLGSTGLGASDSNGFIDKNGEYVQRSCFTAGTLIRTKEGLKPIEKIEIGDLVLSLDPKTGEVSYKKVSRLFSKETPLIHRVTYTNGNVINTTWNHPFFIRGKGFTEARHIQPEERSVTVTSIRNSYRIERSSGIQIGASFASLGSQSSNSNSATWKDEIRGTVGIAKIEEIYEKTKVYNIEVEDNHTYFVGKDGVLVHNDASCGPGYVAGLKEAIASNGGELLGGQTLEERKAETALLREQAPNKKEFDAFYETGKTHVEVGKEAALWYSGEKVLQYVGKGLIKGTEMFLGTEAGINVASKVKGWFGVGEEAAVNSGRRAAGSAEVGVGEQVAIGQKPKYDPATFRDEVAAWDSTKANRFKRAENFYTKGGVAQGPGLDSELRGINFDKPIANTTLKEGEYVYQYVRAEKGKPLLDRQGNYFVKDPSTPMDTIGINPSDERMLVKYKVTSETNSLKSSAADTIWGDGGEVFKGGSTQYYIPNSRSKGLKFAGIVQ
ncbi:TIGR04388 family protein, partial [Leptospira inadai]